MSRRNFTESTEMNSASVSLLNRSGIQLNMAVLNLVF